MSFPQPDTKCSVMRGYVLVKDFKPEQWIGWRIESETVHVTASKYSFPTYFMIKDR